MRKELYRAKAETAMELGGEYILVNNDNLMACKIEEDDKVRLYLGTGLHEFVLTKERYLICVTMNSCNAIREEIGRGEEAYGFVGTVESMWYSENFTKIV